MEIPAHSCTRARVLGVTYGIILEGLFKIGGSGIVSLRPNPHMVLFLFPLELLLMVQVRLWSSWIWEQVLSSSFHGSLEMQKGIISPNMFYFGGWKRFCSLSPLIWVETLTKCSENSDLCINPGLWFAVCPPKPLLDLCGQLGGLPTAWAGIPFPHYRGH